MEYFIIMAVIGIVHMLFAQSNMINECKSRGIDFYSKEFRSIRIIFFVTKIAISLIPLINLVYMIVQIKDYMTYKKIMKENE